MRYLILCAAVAGSLGGIAFAQSKTAVKGAVDGALARLAASGAVVEYVSANLRSDGSVLLNGVTLTNPDGDATVSAEFIEAVPAEEAGYITLRFPAEMLVTLEPDDDPELSYQMAILSEELTYTGNFAQDQAAEGEHDGTLAAQTLQLQGLTGDHPVMNLLDINNSEVLFEVSSSAASQGFAIEGQVAQMSGEYAYDLSEIGQAASADFGAQDAFLSFTSTRPFDEMMSNFDNYLVLGGGFELIMNFGDSVGSSVTRSPQFSMEVSGVSGPTKGRVVLNDEGASYVAEFDAFDYAITPLDGSLPMPPFAVSTSGGLIDIAVPTTPGDAPGEMRYGLELRDVTVGEGLWAMIDPEQTLPRDPATLELGLRAQMLLAAPLAEALMRMQGNPMAAGQIESVSLDKLNLQIAGASVVASGAVEMDNSGFMPVPNGAVDVAIDGVTGLSQSLVALGLIDQMQAGMAMGMLMAFAKPTDQPDSFTSKIEFKDGGIFANGQQLQ